MAHKKYSQQNAIKLMLRDEGFLKYDSLATLLLNTFFERKGIIGDAIYKDSRCYVPGVSYTAWIDGLVAKGWLFRVSKDRITSSADHIRYEQGPKLMDYFNREKAHRDEMASMRDLHEQAARFDEKLDTKADKKEVQALLKEVVTLRGAVEHLIEKHDPPVTEEKIKALQAISADGKTRTYKAKKKSTKLWDELP